MQPITRVASWLVFAVLLGSVIAVSVVGAASHESTVTEFTYSGDGAVGVEGGTRYVWQSAAHSFSVVVDTGSVERDARVCLETRGGSGSESMPLGCVSEHFAANSTVTVAVGVDQWPANATGNQQVTATVRDAGAPDSPVLAQSTLALTVIQEDGDLDADGLTNGREVSSGTRIDLDDTDGDQLLDGEEVDTYGTDPTLADTDGDGLSDLTETSETQTDPTSADTDGDRLTDELEVRQSRTNPNNPDTDGDGLSDGEEVNSYQTDPMNADTDDDGVSDAAELQTHQTDPRTADTDGDGLSDGQEVNVFGTDPTKVNTDGDGLSDYEEVNRYQTNPTSADTDEDGLDDGPEVSVYDTNPNKADTDGDGMSDGDEVHQGSDPTVPSSGAAEPGLLGRLGTSRIAGGLAILGIVAAIGIGVVLVRRSARTDRIEAWVRDALPWPAEGSDDPKSDREPVLTKEDRIIRTLEEHGGRIHQRDIVTETGWSKSTVSRTLSRMEEHGQIVKINVGRGNVIAQPGAEPENAGSPFDR